jgi:hypothetical protein
MRALRSAPIGLVFFLLTLTYIEVLGLYLERPLEAVGRSEG